MRIAIVEPYFGGSHRAWAEGYQANSRHEVELFTHDARFWKWRMHGSYVTLAAEFAKASAPFDWIVASDMLHVPAFLGAIGRRRHDSKIALYMHENQLSYPVSPRDTVDEAYAMINWGSMTVADAVFFNSEFHFDSWFDLVGGLLRRFPDYQHSSLLPAVAEKSEVLPVGVDLARFDLACLDAPRATTAAAVILWNQRWDFDKGPKLFADAMIELATERDFVVALAGEQIGELPDFTRLQATLPDRMWQVGFAAEPDYVRLLASADVVVSTARQEFFGIAITEAVYAGAFPLLPNRLVYPQRIPAEHHDTCLYDEGGLVAQLRRALDDPILRQAVASDLKPVMAAFDWSVVAPLYDERFEALASR